MNKLGLKTLIREIVREEVQLEVRKVLKEGKTAKKQTRPKSTRPVKKAPVKSNGTLPSMSTNPVLNEILQETARDVEDWPTLGDQTMTSADMNTIMSRKLPEQGPNAGIVQSMGVNPDQLPDHVTNALTKDYREVMKAVDQKISQRKM